MTAQYDPKLCAELLELHEQPGPAFVEHINAMATQLRAASAEIERLTLALNGYGKHPEECADERPCVSHMAYTEQCERISQLERAFEQERSSRRLADDTLLKAQNNALKFMNRVKQLEQALTSIERYYATEFHESEKAYQAVIIARAALAGEDAT